MRVLIANDIDLFERSDPRAWAQRAFWFVEEGDVVILSDAPDQDFLDHVGKTIGVDMARVSINISPEGRFGRRQIDPFSLLDEGFTESISRQLGDVSEIFPLFPSAQLGEFASRLGLAEHLPGASFFAQGGSALVNSKATFRAIASGTGVQIAPGSVCWSPTEAAHAMQSVIDTGHDVMVKKTQHGGAAGNEIVLRAGSRLPTNIGGRHFHYLNAADGVARYWSDRWRWASADGVHPVAVERLLNVLTSCYAEFKVTDAGVELGSAGSLTYIERLLACDTLIPNSRAATQYSPLITDSEKLAHAYHSIGYRGRLCADAVITAGGEIVFTEVNARTTTSTHLYEVLRDRIVEPAFSTRTIKQIAAAATWEPVTTGAFLSAIQAAGLAYDPVDRQGILMTMPVPPGEGSKGFLYILVYRSPADEEAYINELDRLFSAHSGR
ncbi:hypothetical protein AB5J55_44075 [Streptomyces sp. R11]|uniref:ATP-grasp domain-containing protein n=1 Tax=Streptomyces sp. R11 TaxID=3238625 RepID=A0AB39NG16_9ACTN